MFEINMFGRGKGINNSFFLGKMNCLVVDTDA